MINLPKQCLTTYLTSSGGFSALTFNFYSPVRISVVYLIVICYNFLSPGYIIAIVARLWPALVKSVVLINSGGNVISRYSSVLFTKVSLIKNVQDPSLLYDFDSLII